MRQDVKEIRTMQIACSFLLRNIPNLKLEQVVSNYYDVVATEMETGIRFGIYITSSFFSLILLTFLHCLWHSLYC